MADSSAALSPADLPPTHVCARLSEAEELAGKLAEEMSERWHRGERPTAEEFLARYPELYGQPEAAVRLIYEEVCLRQESGQDGVTVDVFRRFPQWRDQLEILLGCHHFFQSSVTPTFPVAGEVYEGFRLLSELGRGAQGRVFLATQPALADRPVVVKLTPCDGREHLSLARLQHTFIVPLYAVQDDYARNLRILCMPYFGGVTLAHLLDRLKDRPPAERTGQDLLTLLDEAQAKAAVEVPANGPFRQELARATYVDAVCKLGVCLADALQYAHERGLLHLDLKPSNVLLAADGQPMLLDFHIAGEPLEPGGPMPERFGGTPEYMSPEQKLVVEAVSRGRPIPAAVGARSDLYSLGVLLYQALCGNLPPKEGAVPLYRCNPRVSVGLSDVVCKCLARDPRHRYAGAAALAADLRRHLRHLPLRGVRNRSVRERWVKWRRREPHRLLVGTVALAFVLTMLVAACIGVNEFLTRREDAVRARQNADQLLTRHEYGPAAAVLQRGQERIAGLPFCKDLEQALKDRAAQAQRGEARAREARQLHVLVERLRFDSLFESLPSAAVSALEGKCQTAWENRSRIAGTGAPDLGPEEEEQVRTDLTDLAVLWADLHVRFAVAESAARGRAEADRVLAEAEALFGKTPLLRFERRRCSGREDAGGSPAPVPHTAWEHCVVGRTFLEAGGPDNLGRAAEEFRLAADLQPTGFWPHFYLGTCSYRLGRYEMSAAEFTACVALASRVGEVYYNRGLAYDAQGPRYEDEALHDYTRALELTPGLASAALNRGILHYRRKEFAAALGDLQDALNRGADPAAVHYNLALVYNAQEQTEKAAEHLAAAVEKNPNHAAARRLLERLRKK